MVTYRLNLAKEHVIPMANRRKWYYWLAVYFLVMLVALGGSVYVLFHTILGLRRQREQAAVQERRFLAQRGGGGSMAVLVGKTSRELEECAGQIESLMGFYPRECPPGAILLGLVNVLPAGMDLGEVILDANAGRLNFTVYVPACRTVGEGETPPNLIAQWSVEPLLAGRVSEITAEKSERMNQDGTEVLSWHFTAILKGGK